MRRSKYSIRAASATVALLLALTLLAAGCTNNEQPEADPQVPPSGTNAAIDEAAYAFDPVAPMGKSTGVWYEIFVRSFSDSDGDGIGDLRGAAGKLDYLQELGIRGIWLMPINPSPSYHGYDVTDYYGVNPDYGTLEDLEYFLDEAHRRGIKVIMDLVVNHSSSEHPYFVEAAKEKDSKYREWYTWADEGQDTSALGPWGQTVWHPSGDSHYLGVFWGGMPDLNLDHPDVRKEMIKIGNYWLDLGLDGFRLDAAKHIYEDFSTSTDDPKTWEKNKLWWQEFRAGLSASHPDVYLIGEVWDSLTIVGPFLDGALHSGFNFDLSKQLLDAAKKEQDAPLGSILNKSYRYLSEQSQGAFVDAPFLSNHDSNRVMSEVGGDVNRAKIAASLLLTMPGNPFLYYGEEIGMEGMKPDERIREPMIWAADRESDGQTDWQPLTSNRNTVSVAEQLADPDSLLQHYKKLIAWRNEEPLLGDAGIAAFDVEEEGIIAYARVSEEAKLLVVHNVTSESRTVDLDANGTVPFAAVKFSSTEDIVLKDGSLELPPYSTVILQ